MSQINDPRFTGQIRTTLPLHWSSRGICVKTSSRASRLIAGNAFVIKNLDKADAMGAEQIEWGLDYFDTYLYLMTPKDTCNWNHDVPYHRWLYLNYDITRPVSCMFTCSLESCTCTWDARNNFATDTTVLCDKVGTCKLVVELSKYYATPATVSAVRNIQCCHWLTMQMAIDTVYTWVYGPYIGTVIDCRQKQIWFWYDNRINCCTPIGIRNGYKIASCSNIP